jgi:propanol-preferring alcohol dehydrogenase
LTALERARPNYPSRVKTQIKIYPLERANVAPDDLRAGRFAGAAVLVP